MMRKLGLLALTVVLSLVGLTCVNEPIPAPGTAPAKVETKSPTQIPAKAAWEVEWGKALTEAKKEGKVNIYSNAGPDARMQLTRAFQDKFGLGLEWVGGGGDELVQKFYAERRAGINFADMYMHGSGIPLQQLKPQGFLKPIPPLLLLPEVADPQVWWGGKPFFPDKERRYVLESLLYPSPPMLINTQEVKKEEVRSYKNLLEPRWKGKIVLTDPTRSGQGQQWVTFLAYWNMDVEFLRQLARQEIAVSNDNRLVTEWVARGKYPIAIAPFSQIVAEFQKAGASIQRLTPLEGTLLTGGAGSISVIDRGPHPDATTVFINWFLSKEGQTLYSKVSRNQSARVDVPVNHLGPEDIREPSVRYFVRDEEFALKMAAEGRKLAEEIFGPLIK